MRIYINIRILIIAGIYNIYKPLYILYIKLFDRFSMFPLNRIIRIDIRYMSNHISVPETVPICTE